MALGKKLVRLAPGDWIPVRHVALRIASALRPDRRNAKGAELIQRKLVAVGPEDEPWCPKDLTDEDFRQLENALERLPPIHGNMSEDDKQSFLKEYKSLPLTDRPDWLPSIPTAHDLYREVVAMQELATEHLKSLSQAIRAGALSAVSKNHIQVADLGFDTLVARDEVTRYLRKSGLEVVDQELAGQLEDPAESSQGFAEWFPTSTPKPPPSHETFLKTFSSDGQTLKPYRTKGEWSDTILKELRKWRERLGEPDGPKGWKELELVFGCSRTMMERKLKESR